MQVRAAGDSLTLAWAGKHGQTTELSLSGPVRLTAHGESITIDNPLTIQSRAGVLVLAVSLPVESYVERVVESESSSADGPESLKALAIVVRSFALHEDHGHRDYDLCDSTHCQLLHWGGSSERRAAAHAATLATAGETLWFHGARAVAYFGKDCGGRTAAVEEAWPRASPLPYLSSQPDRYCTGDGGREWASEATREELSAALAAHGLVKPGWQSLTVARRGPSGRALALRLDATEISAEDFRIAVGESLGWNRIPSTWFEVSRTEGVFKFHGRGWGHGVGLCQKGAAAMAAQGRTEAEILAQYFPGTTAADETTGRAWQRLNGNGFHLETLDSSGATFLPQLEQARAEASARSGLNSPTPIVVRAFDLTEQFRAATLAPGWMAAFTEGNWIATQPLAVLAARHLLADTLRHEFLHTLVEQASSPVTPLWLREGLVEAWSQPGSKPKQDTLSLNAVDASLAHASSESESEAAHRAAGAYAAQLLSRYGRTQVLQWLRSGVPAGVVAALGK
jgi:stage II sporulation protein D